MKCEMWLLTFADVTGDAADLSVHHLLVKLFDVERLDSEGQSSRQHGKHTHTSAHTRRNSVRKNKFLIAMKEEARQLDKHTETLSLTQTRRPLWVHTSCERAAQGPRRQDFHTGC